ncbi:protein cornichon homolog 4 [Neocloeon triangulifer]|uniref:protein cornichon homolog 4 n=1 Tax=Neocloeon triangulifer TaxID=2078957 RepID=UPI00286F9B20|nr:protein cornichon homolog 4 [Neocloeon triangulifer]XP_059471969.1 protein cornichon homolog 4 [Neocloeon triangulifer]
MIFSDAILFAFGLIDVGAVLFLLIYFIITLSDLECDYLNAQQCCSKLNFWVVPKIAAQGVFNLFLLMHGRWLLCFINLPMTAWLIYELVTVPMGNTGVYDPTEIHNRGQLKKHMRDCMVYLGFYLVIFFIYLYCMIISILQGNPIKGHDEYATEF